MAAPTPGLNRVVLDSTVICADPWLRGPESHTFLQAPATIQAVVYVPQVVLDESVAFYTRTLQDHLRAAEKLGRWLGPDGPTVPLPDPTQERFRYEEFLRSRLTSTEQVAIIPHPTIAHERLVQRAIARTKPFDEGGSGYRDALIWESILVLLRQRPTPVCW